MIKKHNQRRIHNTPSTNYPTHPNNRSHNTVPKFEESIDNVISSPPSSSSLFTAYSSVPSLNDPLSSSGSILPLSSIAGMTDISESSPITVELMETLNKNHPTANPIILQIDAKNFSSFDNINDSRIFNVLNNSASEFLSRIENERITTTTTLVSNIPEEFCSNSHIVSAETIISFTENTDAILFACTLLSSLLQMYLMVAAVKHIRRKTSDKCMHVFLFSMTFADFILTALCYPVELAPRAGLIQNFPKYVSATMHMLCWIALIVSSLSLVFLNLDKLFYFRFPLRYTNYFTQKRAITLVSGFWLFSSLFVVFAWFTNSFHCVDEDCVTLAIFPNRLHIYIPFMIFVGVIPTITSLAVAIYIMKIVAAHRRQMTEECTLSSSEAPGRSNSVFASRMRTFYFIFMTTVFTAITLLPYRFAGLHRSLNPGHMHDCLTIMLFWIMMYMIYLHSIINPLITVTVLPQYRINFFNAILCRHFSKSEKKTINRDYCGVAAPTFLSIEDGMTPMTRNRLPSEI